MILLLLNYIVCVKLHTYILSLQEVKGQVGNLWVQFTTPLLKVESKCTFEEEEIVLKNTLSKIHCWNMHSEERNFEKETKIHFKQERKF